ncbi:hypothetical protein [Micromonospora globbae]|uniref:hypothetical protein n=1 Tax=Micromonospora globbae TaxID=1894969 RepID=UPI003419AFA5
MEIGVCREHGIRLDAGEERAYERDTPERIMVLMGEDLAGTGDEFVTGVKIESAMYLTAPDGSQAIRVRLETLRRGSAQPGHTEFMLSEKVAGRLAQMLLDSIPLGVDQKRRDDDS